MKSNLAPSTEPLIRTLKTFPNGRISSRNPWKNPKAKNCHVLHRGYQVRESIFPPFAKRIRRSLPSRGGILHYLEKISEESQWEGECFVFHHQVSVTHGLKDGKAVLCFGCRWPLTNEDLSSPDYEEGVSCPKCNGELSERKRESCRAPASGRTRPQAP